LICGSSNLDFHELERVTVYEDGYDKETPTIKYFWEVVHEFNLEEKQKMLKFCTGSDRAPIKGLGNMIFVISRFGPDSNMY
jgi:ubiquitin-protein ligase E3 A